eukprot:scaffold248496_cov12-Tisochrysis_lutea.AAC.1
MSAIIAEMLETLRQTGAMFQQNLEKCGNAYVPMSGVTAWMLEMLKLLKGSTASAFKDYTM